jgi:subtilase family serine protease
MRRSRFIQHSWLAQVLALVMALLMAGLPVFAQSPNGSDHRVFNRPPAGYARPPIHLKGTNASRGPTGMSPAKTRKAYGFDQLANQGAGQTIAIVDAYDDPNIESDLGVFNSQFGLPACTTANGCFRKIYAQGSKPNTNAGWALEISLDVEWAHAIAPQANILLVEAATNSFANLLGAVDVAVANGASVVSMSWGGGEFSGETSYDSHFSVSGVTFTASSGDSGNGVEYPAASPFLVGVGGTTLNVDSSGNYLSESAWSGSGGGISAVENEPSYQATFGIPNDPGGQRGVPDVSYDANPNTGFSVYDTVRYQGQSGWFQVGGTSAGAPQWAALFAIANSIRVAGGKATLTSAGGPIYTVAAGAGYAANYHDITSGTNGMCGTICTAVTGYDYVTGLGSPKANAVINALVALP